MHHCRIDDTLHDRGLYKTNPRHRILELFHDARPWSAYQIEKAIHAVGLATIYRTLRLLVSEGLITPVHTHGEQTFYERAGQEHHDHLQCERCTNVECLPCPVPTLKTPHTLELVGACRTCRT